MALSIAKERPDTPESIALIEELERYIAPLYPHDREHGLSPAELVRDDVAFFIIRSDGDIAGCGGIKFFGKEYGEIMRMYIRPRFRRQGLATRMLAHLERFARDNGVEECRLKTGIHQPEALGLYIRQGYRRIPPFGAYREHPLNEYYGKRLDR